MQILPWRTDDPGLLPCNRYDGQPYFTVIRGSLVKEILLNDPPPPPPPNVPELIASSGESLPSVRDLVELHQQKAQCASCHARFDFIGLGLENFDAIGMWREEELVTHAEHFSQLKNRGTKRKLYPVDASGELPNGEKFKDVHGLKAALMKQERQVAASPFEGLLCYALGRASVLPIVRSSKKPSTNWKKKNIQSGTWSSRWS